MKRILVIALGFLFVATVHINHGKILSEDTETPFMVNINISKGFYNEYRPNETVNVTVTVYFWEKRVDPEYINLSIETRAYFANHTPSFKHYPLPITRLDVGKYYSDFVIGSWLLTPPNATYFGRYLVLNLTHQGYYYNYTKYLRVAEDEEDVYEVVLTSPYEGIDMFYPGDQIPVTVKFFKNGEAVDPDMNDVNTSLQAYYSDAFDERGDLSGVSLLLGWNYTLNRVEKGVYTATIPLPAHPKIFGECSFSVSWDTSETRYFFFGAVDVLYFTLSPFSIWIHEVNVSEDNLTIDVNVWNTTEPVSGASVSLAQGDDFWRDIGPGYDYWDATTNESGVARFVFPGHFRAPSYEYFDILIKVGDLMYVGEISVFIPGDYEITPGRGLTVVPSNISLYLYDIADYLIVGQQKHLEFTAYWDGDLMTSGTVVAYFLKHLSTEEDSVVVLESYNITPNENGKFSLDVQVDNPGLYSMLFHATENGTVWDWNEIYYFGVASLRDLTMEGLLDPKVTIEADTLEAGSTLHITWNYQGDLSNFTPLFSIRKGAWEGSSIPYSFMWSDLWEVLHPGEIHVSADGMRYTVNLTIPTSFPQDEPLTFICGYVLETKGYLLPDEYWYSPSTFIHINYVTLYFSGAENGTLRGRVLDDDGEPVVNATVSAGEYSTRTDEEGYYTLSLPPGEYNVSFTKEGYGSYSAEVFLRPGETSYLNATLVKLPPFWSNLVVTVRNESGSAVEGATVTLSWNNLSAETNATGVAVFNMITVESLTVSVFTEGYIPVVLEVDLNRNSTTYLNVTLEEIPPYPAGSLIGTVIDSETSEAIEGAAITLSSENRTFTASSLSNGSFSFLYIPAGNYTLHVEKEGYQPYTSSVNLPPNSTLTFTIPLVRYPEPSVYGGGVKKEGGKYRFEITYRDPQGRDPQKIVVVVDGKEYTLERSGGNVSEGARYATEIELEGGEHTYYFRVIGPDGEPVKATDSTPTSEADAATFKVAEKKKTSYLLPLLGIIALIIVLGVVLLMLKKPEGGVEE